MLLADARLPVGRRTPSRGPLGGRPSGRASPATGRRRRYLRDPARDGRRRVEAATAVVTRQPTCVADLPLAPVDAGLGGAHPQRRRCAPRRAPRRGPLLQARRSACGPATPPLAASWPASPAPLVCRGPSALARGRRPPPRATRCIALAAPGRVRRRADLGPRRGRSSCCPRSRRRRPAGAPPLCATVEPLPAARPLTESSDGHIPGRRRPHSRGVGRGPRRHRPGGCSVPEPTPPRPAPRLLRLGIGGPVGTGKTALIALLCRELADELRLGVITNDIYTDEDAGFLRCRRSARPRAHPGRRDRRLPAHRDPRRHHRQPRRRRGARGGLRRRSTWCCSSPAATTYGDLLAAPSSTPRSSCWTSPAAATSPRKGGPGIERADLLVDQQDRPSRRTSASTATGWSPTPGRLDDRPVVALSRSDPAGSPAHRVGAQPARPAPQRCARPRRPRPDGAAPAPRQRLPRPRTRAWSRPRLSRTCGPRPSAGPGSPSTARKRRKGHRTGRVGLTATASQDRPLLRPVLGSADAETARVALVAEGALPRR